jgi:hypothetical protein
VRRHSGSTGQSRLRLSGSIGFPSTFQSAPSLTVVMVPHFQKQMSQYVDFRTLSVCCVVCVIVPAARIAAVLRQYTDGRAEIFRNLSARERIHGVGSEAIVRLTMVQLMVLQSATSKYNRTGSTVGGTTTLPVSGDGPAWGLCVQKCRTCFRLLLSNCGSSSRDEGKKALDTSDADLLQVDRLRRQRIRSRSVREYNLWRRFCGAEGSSLPAHRDEALGWKHRANPRPLQCCTVYPC